jgi:hypothetical protein
MTEALRKPEKAALWLMEGLLLTAEEQARL